jgi:hypothetical protein
MNLLHMNFCHIIAKESQVNWKKYYPDLHIKGSKKEFLSSELLCFQDTKYPHSTFLVTWTNQVGRVVWYKKVVMQNLQDMQQETINLHIFIQGPLASI